MLIRSPFTKKSRCADFELLLKRVLDGFMHNLLLLCLDCHGDLARSCQHEKINACLLQSLFDLCVCNLRFPQCNDAFNRLFSQKESIIAVSLDKVSAKSVAPLQPNAPSVK